MKFLSVLMIVIASILLTGCAQFSDGSSVWQDFMWVIPTMTGIGAVIFGVLAYKSSKSNSKWNPNLGRTGDAGNVPIYKLGYFVFSMILVVATIIIIFMVTGDK